MVEKVEVNFRYVFKFVVLIFLFFLAFVGIFRIFYLNTNCDGFSSYYEVEDNYGFRTGFLNLKTIFSFPSDKVVYCYINFCGRNFSVLESGKVSDNVLINKTFFD